MATHGPYPCEHDIELGYFVEMEGGSIVLEDDVKPGQWVQKGGSVVLVF